MAVEQLAETAAVNGETAQLLHLMREIEDEAKAKRDQTEAFIKWVVEQSVKQ